MTIYIHFSCLPIVFRKSLHLYNELPNMKGRNVQEYHGGPNDKHNDIRMSGRKNGIQVYPQSIQYTQIKCEIPQHGNQGCVQIGHFQRTRPGRRRRRRSVTMLLLLMMMMMIIVPVPDIGGTKDNIHTV